MIFKQSLKRKADDAFKERRNGFAAPKVVNFSVETKSEPPPTQGDLKQQSPALLSQRQALPIFKHADSIRQALKNHDVLLLAGETGSGKSTQVPQFLVDESWCISRTVPRKRGSPGSADLKEKVGGCIAITQPRRVAAISLARRVAQEMGTPLGRSSRKSTVGYSVRFDQSVSPNTRIKFLTEGMLLQEMLRDAALTDYSAVIVDEVHERGANVDLILGLLRSSLEKPQKARGGSPLKIVVMSATADMEVLQNFFSTAKESEPISGNGSDSLESEKSGTSRSSHLTTANPHDTESRSSSPTNLIIKGRQHPVEVVYPSRAVTDWLETAVERIKDIHLHQPAPGDILVFLTGQETIETLLSMCLDLAKSLETTEKQHHIPRLSPIPLFAALPQQAQQEVFRPARPGTRKVILSTNIAETSVTVPGVRYVIDSGKFKHKQFRTQLGLDSLLVKPVSKSSANQRKGRAGREAPGICYRLYPEDVYLGLPQDNEPEILRCDLSQVVLALKARGVSEVADFPWLTQPSRRAMERAVIQLLQLEALDQVSGLITDLGREMALLPLPATLAKVLLTSMNAEYSCADECIDIISALSGESVFLNMQAQNEERRDAVEAARRTLYRREGDHLTLLAAVQAYAEENSDRKSWCEDRAISHRAMQAVMDVRKQLKALLKSRLTQMTRENGDNSGDSTLHGNISTLQDRILKAFLTGFTGNIALLGRDGAYRTLARNQLIAVHPSSVLFGRKVEAIFYNEFVFTQKAYARNVSAIEAGWIGA